MRGTIISTTATEDKKAVALKKKSGIKLDIGTKTTLIISVFLLLLMVVFPLLNILSRAFEETGKEVFANIFSSSVIRGVIKNTIILGMVVATLGTLIGFFLAYAQVKLNFRGKKLLHIISLVPLITPPFAFATAVISLFGRSGIITRDILGFTPTLYGLPGLTIVLTCSFFPVAYMSILGMMKNLDPALDEASASLGASKFKTFFKVTLPMLIPGFASSFLLLFVEASADLANPLVIGGDYTVLASRAYIAINGEYDVPAGSAYSLILLIPGLIVFVVQRYWGERKSVVSVTGKPTGTPTYIESRIAKFFLLLIPVLIASFIVLIYTTVIFGSFAKFLGVDNSLTLENYRYIFSGVGHDAIIKTTLMAIIATPIAGILGMVLAWLIVRKVRKGREFLDFLGMLGLAVPGTVLGIGFAITFNHTTKIGETSILPQLAGGGAIFGGAVAIIMVYTIRSSPAGQRSGIAARCRRVRDCPRRRSCDSQRWSGIRSVRRTQHRHPGGHCLRLDRAHRNHHPGHVLRQRRPRRAKPCADRRGSPANSVRGTAGSTPGRPHAVVSQFHRLPISKRRVRLRDMGFNALSPPCDALWPLRTDALVRRCRDVRRWHWFQGNLFRRRCIPG